MKKLLIVLLSSFALINAKEPIKIHAGSDLLIKLEEPTVSIQTLASIRYAQKWHATKDKKEFKDPVINENLKTALKQHADSQSGNFFEMAKRIDAKQAHQKELVLQKYKADIRNAYFKTAERIRKINNEYETKLESAKYETSDLSASNSFIDMGHAETARKVIDEATDQYRGIRITRFFNTCGLANETSMNKFSEKSKNMVEEFIKVGKADLAQEYAHKIEDAKDFCFFESIKKSARKNNALCSYDKKDRQKLFGIIHTFKTDVRNLYEKDKKALTQQISEKTLDENQTFNDLEKDYNQNLNPFIEQQLDTILCVPFMNEKIDDTQAFKKTYSDRAKQVVQSQKTPTLEDGVFRYAYDNFHKLQEFCKTLIK